MTIVITLTQTSHGNFGREKQKKELFGKKCTHIKQEHPIAKHYENKSLNKKSLIVHYRCFFNEIEIEFKFLPILID
jgi:hypothetical protein